MVETQFARKLISKPRFAGTSKIVNREKEKKENGSLFLDFFLV